MKSSSRFLVPVLCFLALIGVLSGLSWAKGYCLRKYAPQIAWLAQFINGAIQAGQQAKAEEKVDSVRSQQEADELSNLTDQIQHVFKEYQSSMGSAQGTAEDSSNAAAAPDADPAAAP